jgi:hypothetical protein
MSPSAILLNACAATFLALFVIFTSYLIARFIRLRQQQNTEERSKQVSFYSAPAQASEQPKAKLRLEAVK